MSQVIASALITPDGTILQSYHRHDYKTYTDKNGEEYMIDGGVDYCRSNVNNEPAQYITVTMEDPHSLRRKWFHWGTRGVNGDQPLVWKPLKDLDTDHIKAILSTQYHIGEHLIELFEDELHFRHDALGEIV
jgi:hypothetical protein